MNGSIWVLRAAIPVALLTVASPAHAAPVLAPAVGIPSTGRHNVVPQCNASVGVATNLEQVLFVVQGSAEAYSTNGSYAIATGVTCVVVDARTGATYGSTPGQAMPGPVAATAAIVAVPMDSTPKLCGYAHALFSDNQPAYGRTVGC